MIGLSISVFADKIDEILPDMMKGFAKMNSAEFYKSKITMPQFVIMNILDKLGKARMTDLAHQMNVTTAAMTGIIDRLVREGCVRRQNDPNDRRIVLITSTQRGTTLVKRINEHRRNMIITIFGRLSQEEREQYLKILTRVRDTMKT